MRISTSSPVCHVLASSVRRDRVRRRAPLFLLEHELDGLGVGVGQVDCHRGASLDRGREADVEVDLVQLPHPLFELAPPATKAHLHEELFAPLEDVATSLELGEAGEVELGLFGHADRAELDTSLVDQAGEGFVVAGF